MYGRAIHHRPACHSEARGEARLHGSNHMFIHRGDLYRNNDTAYLMILCYATAGVANASQGEAEGGGNRYTVCVCVRETASLGSMQEGLPAPLSFPLWTKPRSEKGAI